MSDRGGMQPFSIAPALAADVPDVARLFRDYEARIGVDLSYQGFASELATLPGLYAAPGGQLLVARSADGAALGCVALRPGVVASAAEMKRLYVASEGRGRGLGRALAEAIVDEAARLGYAEVHLDTLPTMQAAIALYRQLGFTPIAPYYAAPAGTIFLGLHLDDRSRTLAPQGRGSAYTTKSADR